MQKYARKPSSDPVQEKLRESKATWNKEVSELLTNLINFKKLMNGYPSTFHNERSFIKEPIPADPHTILGVLLADFNDIANEGNQIIQQQVDYSQNRRKKQEKSTLSQQLTANIEYELEALASNKITRTLSKLRNPWFGGTEQEKRDKKYRVSLLNACADLEKQIKRFQENILGKSPESIFIASKVLDKVSEQINFIFNSISAYKSVFQPPVVEHNDPNYFNEKVDQIIDDFERNHLNFTDLNTIIVNKLIDLIYQYKENINEPETSKLILQNYQELIDDYNKKHNLFAKTLGEALFIRKSAMEKLAQEFIKNWTKKLIHQLSPFDKTSSIRLDAFKVSQDALKILDEMMNSLEVSFEVDKIVSYTSSLYQTLSNIQELMKPLIQLVKQNLYDKKFVDNLKSDKFLEFGVDLDRKDKEKLRNLIKNRQIKDLRELYLK